MKIRIFSIGNAKISLNNDPMEHDELVRLREENRHLKSAIADKDNTISEQRKLVNHFIAQG